MAGVAIVIMVGNVLANFAALIAPLVAPNVLLAFKILLYVFAQSAAVFTPLVTAPLPTGDAKVTPTPAKVPTVLAMGWLSLVWSNAVE